MRRETTKLSQTQPGSPAQKATKKAPKTHIGPVDNSTSTTTRVHFPIFWVEPGVKPQIVEGKKMDKLKGNFRYISRHWQRNQNLLSDLVLETSAPAGATTNQPTAGNGHIHRRTFLSVKLAARPMFLS